MVEQFDAWPGFSKNCDLCYDFRGRRRKATAVVRIRAVGEKKAEELAVCKEHDEDLDLNNFIGDYAEYDRWDQ